MSYEIERISMPPGEYWVGDPCYAVPQDEWEGWLERADFLNYPAILIAEVLGVPVVGIPTRYGDGAYLDEEGNEYPVDAGLIGAVPVALTGPVTGMHRRTFDEPFSCWSEDGVIHIGSVIIDTDPDDEL